MKMSKIYTVRINGFEDPFVYYDDEEYKDGVTEFKHTSFSLWPYGISIKTRKDNGWDVIYSTAFSIQVEHILEDDE